MGRNTRFPSTQCCCYAPSILLVDTSDIPSLSVTLHIVLIVHIQALPNRCERTKQRLLLFTLFLSLSSLPPSSINLGTIGG